MIIHPAIQGTDKSIMDLRDADMLQYCIVEGGTFEYLNFPDPPVCVAIKQRKSSEQC